MIDLKSYINQEQDKFSFSQQQASDFAKNIAGDFNPIHNVGAKKFIVPGDLLFSLILQQSGLSTNMHLTFSGMVRDNTWLYFKSLSENKIALIDTKDKEYVACEASGDITKNEQIIAEFIREYVSFSGKAFPHLLASLMEQENAMINLARPMIIYESMSVHLDHLDISGLTLELHQSSFDVTGKRGRVCLQFDLLSVGEKVGCGKKYMLLSGLREYDQSQIDQMISDYTKVVSEYNLAEVI
ncbi:MAG: DUF3581 family protein [Pseudomonadota bacterium]